MTFRKGNLRGERFAGIKIPATGFKHRFVFKIQFLLRFTYFYLCVCVLAYIYIHIYRYIDVDIDIDK